MNINVDINTHFDSYQDVDVPEEFKNPHTSINAASLDQYDEDYIWQNADLDSRPSIRSS